MGLRPADGSEISIRSAIGVQDAEWGIWDMLELRGTQVFRETIADRETSNQQVSEPPSATSGGTVRIREFLFLTSCLVFKMNLYLQKLVLTRFPHRLPPPPCPRS